MTRKTLAALLLFTITSTGCLRQHRASPAALIRLTKAAQARIAYEDTTSTDQQILEAVYAKNPELRDELGRFAIRTKRDGNNIVILVCSPDEKTGFLEDASWTLKVDRKWKNHPCTFDPTLDPHNPTPERVTPRTQTTKRGQRGEGSAPGRTPAETAGHDGSVSPRVPPRIPTALTP